MPYGCTEQEQYIKLNCSNDVFAYNKIVALVVIYDKSTIEADPSNAANWATALANEEIAVINDFKGEYDGGEVEEGEGFGTRLNKIDGETHTITGEVEYNKKNISFFNKLKTADNEGIAFITGDNEEMHVVLGVNVSYTTKAIVTREKQKIREFMLTAKWAKIEIPPSYPVPAGLLD
jgi:hypothetical protein